jgi:hypothetical protein
MLLQYQPRICHLSILRLEQSSQHLQGNAWRWLWHVQALPPSLSRLGGSLVFRPDARFYTPVGPCIVVMVILAHAIAKVLKTERKKSWLEGGDFLNGHHCSSCRPSPPPPHRSWALLQLAVAAANVGLWPPRVSHKASAAVTINFAVLWFPTPAASLMEGVSRIKKIDKKRSVSGLMP